MNNKAIDLASVAAVNAAGVAPFWIYSGKKSWSLDKTEILLYVMDVNGPM